MLRSMQDQRIGFVGAGNMATALLRGLLAAGRLTAEQVRFSEIDRAKREQFATSHGVSAAASNAELGAWASVLVLAVKPQTLPSVLQESAARLNPQALVLSIAAGVRTSTLSQALPQA